MAIVNGVDEFLKTDKSLGEAYIKSCEAYNQIVTMYSFTEKNAQCILQFLKIYQQLANTPSDWKLDNPDKMIAYTLERYMDKLCESQAFDTYLSFLKRSDGLEFHHNLSLAVLKQGYYNV